MSDSRKYRSTAEAFAAYQRKQAYAAHVDVLFDQDMTYKYQRPDWRTFLSPEQIEHERWLFRQDRNAWLRKHTHRARVFSYGPKPPGFIIPPLGPPVPADPPPTPLTDDPPPPESSK